MNAEIGNGIRDRSMHLYDGHGWGRTAQDAAESLTSTDADRSAPPQPFLKRRMGYSTKGAFLAIVLFLLTLVAFLATVGAAMGPWDGDGCICF